MKRTINNKLVLTSAKVHIDLLEKVKLETLKNKFTQQKLINRAIHLYITDEEFREKIHNHDELVMSGSI